MLSENQKAIYNKHLIVSRKSRNKPFKIKTDFSDITPATSNNLIKLEKIQSKFPNLDFDVYFKAPYELWPDTQYFPLEYFTTQAAIRAFTVYKKQILDQNIDSEASVKSIKNSLIFIAKFCTENKLSLQNYYTYKNGISYSWAGHIRKGLINPYIIFGFNNIDEIIFKIPEDERSFVLGSFSENYFNYKENFNKSKVAKHTIIRGLSKINLWINKEITVEKDKK